MAVEREDFERVDELDVYAACQPLVSARRVTEAVGDDPAAGVEIGRDELIDVVEPRRCEENRLGARAPALGSALEDEGADSFRARRAPGFARPHGGDRVSVQGGGQPL